MKLGKVLNDSVRESLSNSVRGHLRLLVVSKTINSIRIPMVSYSWNPKYRLIVDIKRMKI